MEVSDSSWEAGGSESEPYAREEVMGGEDGSVEFFSSSLQLSQLELGGVVAVDVGVEAPVVEATHFEGHGVEYVLGSREELEAPLGKRVNGACVSEVCFSNKFCNVD